MKGHIMARRYEIGLGFVLTIVGCVLLWDAFDNRGKRLPWPLSAFMPW